MSAASTEIIAPSTDTFDPLAQKILEAAIRRPSSLSDIPLNLRNRQEWFRPIVRAAVVATKRHEHDAEGGKAPNPLEYASEYLADAELRHLAGMGSLPTEQAIRNMEHLAAAHFHRPSLTPLPGTPALRIDTVGYVNGNVRLGICDVCGKKDVLIQGHISVLADKVEMIRTRICACTPEVFESEHIDPAKLLDLAYKGPLINGLPPR
jgi:hypothetical protein